MGAMAARGVSTAGHGAASYSGPGLPNALPSHLPTPCPLQAARARRPTHWVHSAVLPLLW